jgi:hypothetical protein
MIGEDRLEFRTMLSRLASEATDIGLTHAEIAAIAGLPAGGWPICVAAQWSSDLEAWQEARLRNLSEVCSRLMMVFGADAPLWLRRASGRRELSPIAFLLSDRAALRALRDVLRLEDKD